MLSSSTYRKHSTARRNQPCTKQRSRKLAYQSATTQASRQRWPKLACRRAFIQLAAFSKRMKKSKSTRQKMYNHSQSTCCCDVQGLAFISIINTIQHCFLSVFSMYFVHACGVRVFYGAWALGFLQVVNLHLKLWTSLSASFAFCSMYCFL